MTGGKGKKSSGCKKLTGYILFCRENRQKCITKKPSITFGEISRIIGREWSKLDKKQQGKYQSRATKLNRESEKKLKSNANNDVMVEENESYEVIDLVEEEENSTAKSSDSSTFRKSSRSKKSTVVYQSPDPGLKSQKSHKTVAKTQPTIRSLRSEVDLIMECVDEDLSPAQVRAIKNAQDEHEKANELIKEFRAGNILVPSSQPNTFIVTPASKPTQPSPPAKQQLPYNMVQTEPVSGGPPPRPAQFLNKQQQLQQKDVAKPQGAKIPDLILIGENRPPVVSSQPLLSSVPQQTMTTINVQQAGITPQQMFKYVNVSTVSPTLVQNQWALRPLLKVPPQQSQNLVLSQEPGNISQLVPLNQAQLSSVQQQPVAQSKSSTQATGQKRQPSGDTFVGPPAKKKNTKIGDYVSDNWIPLDEYYYGTHDGDTSYTEEKGEYRFKCWYCSKMLYNNVRAMQHIQGHIDASKQQNIDLSDLTQCKHCYKQFDTPFEMQTHVEKVHLSNKVLMCRICEKDFPSQTDLVTHMKTQHRVCEMPYVCQLCQFRSSMYSDVVDHFKKKHDSSNYLLCLYCLRSFEVKFVSQGWGQTQTYYGHLLKHQTKSASKKCGLCRLMFFNSIDVKTHRKTCHTSNPMNIQGYSGGNKSDLGSSQKKGSSLKSLNAPSVSRIQDYGEISFPVGTKYLNCVECKMLMSSTDHYKKYIHCTMCRFATSCSVAYANHMMGFHSGQMSSLNLNIPWERPIKNIMYCTCGFSSKYGNKIANHLVQCGKWTSYWKRPVTTNVAPSTKRKPDDKKDEGSLLDMLGLVQKKSVAPTLNIPGEIHDMSKKKNENVDDSTKDVVKIKKEVKKTGVDIIDITNVMKGNETETDTGTSIVEDPMTEAEVKNDKHVEKSDEIKHSSDDKETKVERDNDDDEDNIDDKTTLEGDKGITSACNKSEDTPCSANKDEDLTEISEENAGPEESSNVEEEVETEVKSKMSDDVVKESMAEEEEMDQNDEAKEDESKDTGIESEKVEEKADGSDDDNEEKSEEFEDETEDKNESKDLDLMEDKVTEDEKITELFDENDEDEFKDGTNEQDMEMNITDDKDGEDVMETDGNKEEASNDKIVESDVDFDKGGNNEDDEAGDVSTEESMNLTGDTLETIDDAADDGDDENVVDKKDEGTVQYSTDDKKQEIVTEPSTNDDTEEKSRDNVNEPSTSDDTMEVPTEDDTSSKSNEPNISKDSTDRHGNQDNRSHGSFPRSESGSRSLDPSRDRSHDTSRDRSHDRDRSHETSRDRSHDRDRSYDRDRDRNRDRDRGDWNRDRNRDYNRHHDHHRSGGGGYGHQDNRDRGYRGNQGHRDGYHGNRDYQNRGGHHQDRNFNRNYNNRGGYNQNYRGGYRGGYY